MDLIPPHHEPPQSAIVYKTGAGSHPALIAVLRGYVQNRVEPVKLKTVDFSPMEFTNSGVMS